LQVNGLGKCPNCGRQICQPIESELNKLSQKEPEELDKKIDDIFRSILKGVAKAQELDYKNIVCRGTEYALFLKRIRSLLSQQRTQTIEEIKKEMDKEIKKLSKSIKNDGSEASTVAHEMVFIFMQILITIDSLK